MSLQFDIRQLNVRLSYNDAKLFATIAQNLPSLQSNGTENSYHTEIEGLQSCILGVHATVRIHTHYMLSCGLHPVEEVVRQLLPLGFSRAAILRELARADSSTNIASLKEILTERMAGEKPHKDQDGMSLKSIQVHHSKLILILPGSDHAH